MKNLFIITGASRGIGRAIVHSLDKHFKSNDNTFFLIARDGIKLEQVKGEVNGRAVILPLDLSHPEESAIAFEEGLSKLVQEFDRCVLINNAGVIRPIGFLGTLDNRELADNVKVNLISPLLLTNSFLKIFKRSKCERIVVNISSGAGRMPIACWSGYCSSKAGMDMFAKVLREENPQVKVFSVAPGIIETDMQKDIRLTPATDFPLHSHFVHLSKTGALKSPEESGEEIVRLIKNPERFETIVSF